MRYPEMKGYKPAFGRKTPAATPRPSAVKEYKPMADRQAPTRPPSPAENKAYSAYMQQLGRDRGQMARPPARFKDGGDTKSTRPGMVQPPSEAEFMFDSSNKDMRKQLKGMSPHVTEPVYDSAPTPPPKNTKKETVKKAGGGSCYAGGGMTRADGCAQRGKTRCKVY